MHRLPCEIQINSRDAGLDRRPVYCASSDDSGGDSAQGSHYLHGLGQDYFGNGRGGVQSNQKEVVDQDLCVWRFVEFLSAGWRCVSLVSSLQPHC